MTRRIFAFVLAAVMLLSVIPVHAAAGEPTFVVDTVTAAAGETVEVTIRLENNPGVTSLKLYMEYDSALTLTGVSHNPDLGSNFLVSPEGKYPVYLNWYDGLKDVSGDWVFVTLTFAVAEDAAEGTYPVSITYDANDVFDANEDNVYFAIQNGCVTVEPANVSVTGVVLDQTSLSLTEGQTAQLTATVTPANATNPDVSFTSSAPEVAGVDGSGKVTAHKEGTATVTVTTADGGLTATCTVTISCAHGSKTEVPSKSADCVTAGNYLYYVCDTCAQAFKADGVTKTTVEAETIPATGHDLTPVAAVDAKCEQEGSIAYYTCACGAWFSDAAGKQPITDKGSVILEKLGHSYTNYVTDNNETCVEDGTETAKCDRCDATDTVKKVGSATGHTMGDWYETKAPTCTDKGTEQRDCANCEYFETREIAAKGHEYTAAVTAPTCTGQGYTTHTCACGDSYVDSYVDALGHSWDDGVVTKEPTEKEEGVRTYTCGICSETKTESIPVLDHTHKFSPVVTAPTCTEEGYTTFLCTCGESYVNQRTDALGHSWGEWEETKAPNYLEFGERTHTCIRCDAYETEEINNNPFTDVGDGNRFKTQILWAYYEGITSGKTATTFAPNSEVTRAQFVTFLWRSAGSPEPKSQENPFTDVTSGNRFLQAILWAYHEGITSGTTATTFSPNNTCTRGQVVMFLYRYAGSPEVTDVENPFEDVSTGNRFYNAIMWAVDEGITSGKTATTFEINGACTRAQVVTFLYRYLRS